MNEAAPDPKVPEAVWLTEWDRYPLRGAKFEYAEREVDRLIADGLPVAHLAVLLALPMQQDAVFAALRERRYRPVLRLIAGAKPPPSRPNGHLEMPPEKKGKVLFAKTRTLGPAEGPDAAGASATQWSGPGRQHKIQIRKPLVEEIEITREPRTTDLDQANVVLRQWGVATHSKRFVPFCEIRIDKEGRAFKHVDEHGADRWLVEEVTPVMLEREAKRNAPKREPGPSEKTGEKTASA